MQQISPLHTDKLPGITTDITAVVYYRNEGQFVSHTHLVISRVMWGGYLHSTCQ